MRKTPLFVGLAVLWGAALWAHPITLDGLTDDWTGTPPVFANTFKIDSTAGEAIWRDAADDDLGDGDYTYPLGIEGVPFLGTEADLVEFRATDNPDSGYLYFLIRLQDFDVQWKPIVVLTLDLDHTWGSGQIWLAQNADYWVDSLVLWEYTVVVWDGWVKVMDSGWNDLTDSLCGAVFNADNDVIEVRVHVNENWALPPWEMGGAYYGLAVGLQDFGNFREVDSVASDWHGGGGVGEGEGGIDWVDPDVYDLGFATDQVNDLNTYVYDTASGFWQPAVLRAASTRYIPHPVPEVGPACTCGDLNNDGVVDPMDLVFMTAYFFQGGPAPQYPECADVDGSGAFDKADIAYLANYLFTGGPAPNCP